MDGDALNAGSWPLLDTVPTGRLWRPVESK
jgi:hypothetical protein